MNKSKDWSAIVTAAFILAGLFGSLWVNWPGHLSYDSILQLLQGRTGIYNTWHPPVMAWLLGLGDAILPGTGIFIVFDGVLAFGALLSILLFRRRPVGWAVPVIALAIALSPQLLLYQGLIWKDVLFADTAVAGFAAVAHAAARWSDPRLRYALSAAAFLLLVVAALTRQNGAVLLPFAAAAAGWIALKRGVPGHQAALLGGGLLAATLIAVFAATTALNLRSDGEPGTAEQFRLLEVYDLAGAAAREPTLPMSDLARNAPALAQRIRVDGAKLYTPVRNDPLLSAPDLQAAITNTDPALLRAQWLTLIGDYPWLYLKVRAADFAWVLLTPDIVACRPIFTGIEGPAPEMQKLGLLPRRDARDLALERYGKAFMGTPVLSHVTFLVLGAGCLWLLLRRRRPADIAIAFLLLGASAFTASFFVISISCDYRYLYVLDLSVMTALLYLALDMKSAIRGST